MIITFSKADVNIPGEETPAENEEPMQDFYSKGSRNLWAIAKSDIPETLVGILAENKWSKEVMSVIIDAISNSSLYRPIATKFASMGVLKDLVLFIADHQDFWSGFVKAAIDSIWNIIEVGGSVTTQTMA